MVRCVGGGLFGRGLDLKASRDQRSLTQMSCQVYAREAPGLLGTGRWSCWGQTQAGGAAA